MVAYLLRYVAIIILMFVLFGMAGSISDLLFAPAAVATLCVGMMLTFWRNRLGRSMAIPFFAGGLAQAILAYAASAARHDLPWHPWLGTIAPVAILGGLVVFTIAVSRHLDRGGVRTADKFR